MQACVLQIVTCFTSSCGAAVFLQVCVHMCVKQGDRGGDRDRPDIGTAKNGKVGLATKSQVTERGFVIHSLNT